MDEDTWVSKDNKCDATCLRSGHVEALRGCWVLLKRREERGDRSGERLMTAKCEVREKWVKPVRGGHAWHVDYIINTRLRHATPARCFRFRHRLQFGFLAPFRYTSLSTFRFPNLSIRRALSLSSDTTFLRDTSSPPSNLLFSSSPASSSSSSRFRLTPLRPVPPFPPPILMFTRGGTAKPNAFPTLARSSLFTSNIFLRE